MTSVYLLTLDYQIVSKCKKRVRWGTTDVESGSLDENIAKLSLLAQLPVTQDESIVKIEIKHYTKL